MPSWRRAHLLKLKSNFTLYLRGPVCVQIQEKCEAEKTENSPLSMLKKIKTLVNNRVVVMARL
jgi:hypothetical protein